MHPRKVFSQFITSKPLTKAELHIAIKSIKNVKELFDSSVPLDLDDLKAEFDNAPVPSLDNDDILRGKVPSALLDSGGRGWQLWRVVKFYDSPWKMFTIFHHCKPKP